jgi:hypothetical protein
MPTIALTLGFLPELFIIFTVILMVCEVIVVIVSPPVDDPAVAEVDKVLNKLLSFIPWPLFIRANTHS